MDTCRVEASKVYTDPDILCTLLALNYYGTDPLQFIHRKKKAHNQHAIDLLLHFLFYLGIKTD